MSALPLRAHLTRASRDVPCGPEGSLAADSQSQIRTSRLRESCHPGVGVRAGGAWSDDILQVWHEVEARVELYVIVRFQNYFVSLNAWRAVAQQRPTRLAAAGLREADSPAHMQLQADLIFWTPPGGPTSTIPEMRNARTRNFWSIIFLSSTAWPLALDKIRLPNSLLTEPRRTCCARSAAAARSSRATACVRRRKPIGNGDVSSEPPIL